MKNWKFASNEENLGALMQAQKNLDDAISTDSDMFLAFDAKEIRNHWTDAQLELVIVEFMKLLPIWQELEDLRAQIVRRCNV